MNKENEHIVSEELLFRHFANDVSEEENTHVENWINESEKNRLEYERIHIFYLDMKALNSLQSSKHRYNTELAWQKVKEKNSIVGTIPSGFQINISFNALKVAAMLLIFIGMAMWFTYDTVYKVNMTTSSALDLTKELKLTDGSIITLNSYSQLVYPDKFQEEDRSVKLLGEAYFNISHDPKRPFIIETDELQIKVLGTSFNVNASKDTSKIVISVDTGRVLVSSALQRELLEAGMVGIYDKNTKKLSKLMSTKSGIESFWLKKSLYFDSTPLVEVVEIINGAYGTKVQLAAKDIGHCRISVSFENESIKNVLDIISTTLDLEVKQQHDTYILNGEGCNY